MDIHIEKEYKILVEEETFATLCKLYEPLTFIEQTNDYFDTSNKDMQNKKGAMRIRTIKEQYIFTLKLPTKKGLMEYECLVSGNQVTALDCVEVQQLLRSLHIDTPLKKTVSVCTKRAVYENEYAQLCFDISKYGNTIDYEIEYEYKKEHNGRRVFNAILSKVGLHYTTNCVSKIQRATRERNR